MFFWRLRAGRWHHKVGFLPLTDKRVKPQNSTEKPGFRLIHTFFATRQDRSPDTGAGAYIHTLLLLLLLVTHSHHVKFSAVVRRVSAVQTRPQPWRTLQPSTACSANAAKRPALL